MSRPKPKIIMEQVDRRTYKSEQVLAADAVYAVVYRDRPIGVRKLSLLLDNSAKYSKTAFVNIGHAHNLADKLNEKFKTDEFKVGRFTEFKIVIEGEE